MPRLSLYKPERGQDYKFIDRQISEMFQVGGTDVYLHKYLGPKNPTTGTLDQPIYTTQNVANIQDLLFLENRDRKYDTEIYRIRGLYNVANIDFNLSQFGLFLDQDTVFMTVHINDFIKYIGRKPISGDVVELPHLRDQFALGDADISLPRYFVIEDVGRASEGFSATWYPHLYRLKLKKLTNNQQFADILNMPAGADLDKFAGEYDPEVTYHAGEIIRYNGTLYTVTADTTGNVPPNTSFFSEYNNTLESILSTRAKELEINDRILQQAEVDAPKSGYETRQFYTLAVGTDGKPILNTADATNFDASNSTITAQESSARPVRTGYTGYLVGDGFPVNGHDFGHGIQFPEGAVTDDFFLRTDFLPNRLFRFNGSRWTKIEDAVRMSMTNDSNRQTLKTGFINNTEYIYNEPTSIIDSVALERGDTVIDTIIDYATAPYIRLKLSVVILGFSTADYSNILSSYSYTDPVTLVVSDKVRITLPIINSDQIVIPETGIWSVGLYNNREEVRQSLSKALRPKADL
jgi:hypothetical protein